MANPFVYGEVVPATAFVDRHDELKRLSADLLAGQKVFLISPRRYGKSSLISRALARAGNAGCLTVSVTVSAYSSYLAFLEGYARAVVAAETRWSRAVTWQPPQTGLAWKWIIPARRASRARAPLPIRS